MGVYLVPSRGPPFPSATEVTHRFLMKWTSSLLLLVHLWSAVSLLLTPLRTHTSPVEAPSMKLGGGGGLQLWRGSRRPSVVGLVGGIASGKTTISKVLATECGLEVIDADKLGHESYQPGTRCFGKLVDAFGAKIVAGDGTIDRRELGAAVGSVAGCCRKPEQRLFGSVTSLVACPGIFL